MQQIKLKKPYIIKQSEIVLLENIIKVKMSDDILTKIKYLCQKIPKVEWSGIILYLVEGTISDPANMKIILKDIIPMNKGTEAYTEYKYNEKKRDISGYDDKMIDYYNDNPRALDEDWKIGHLHSHNTMAVFFSGVDLDELRENSPSHNFYFSLIVNNFMDFCAKVAIASKSESRTTEKFTGLNEKGREYVINSYENKNKNYKIYTYDCEIEYNKEELEIDELFKNSVDDIMKKSKFSYYKKTPDYSFSSNTSTRTPSLFDDNSYYDKDFYNYQIGDDFDIDKNIYESESEVEDFAIDLLKTGLNKKVPYPTINTLKDIVKHLEYGNSFKIRKNIVPNIMKFYNEIYNMHFHVQDKTYEKAILDLVILRLEDFEFEFTIITELVNKLKRKK